MDTWQHAAAAAAAACRQYPARIYAALRFTREALFFYVVHGKLSTHRAVSFQGQSAVGTKDESLFGGPGIFPHRVGLLGEGRRDTSACHVFRYVPGWHDGGIL